RSRDRSPTPSRDRAPRRGAPPRASARPRWAGRSEGGRCRASSKRGLELRGRRAAAWPGSIFDAHGRVGLERAVEPQLLPHLADGGEHLLAEQANRRPRVLIAHEAVARPEPDDRRARLVEEPPEPR